MHLTRTFVYGFCFVLTLLSGCKSINLDYPLPYSRDKLVINGLLSPDRVAGLRLTRTIAATGKFPDSLGVTNATVAFFEEGKFIENLSNTTGGNYLSPSGFKPLVGKSYHVKAAASGFPDAETIPETIPSLVVMNQYAFDEEFPSTFNESNTAQRLFLNFTDNAGEADYYSVEMLASYEGIPIKVNTYALDRYDEADDPCGFWGGNNLAYVMTDVCFNGGPYAINIAVELQGFRQQPPFGEVTCDQLTVNLHHISRNYYEYLKTGNQPEGFLLAFAEPNILHSNVKGGFGILAAYNEYKVSFEIK